MTRAAGKRGAGDTPRAPGGTGRTVPVKCSRPERPGEHFSAEIPQAVWLFSKLAQRLEGISRTRNPGLSLSQERTALHSLPLLGPRPFPHLSKPCTAQAQSRPPGSPSRAPKMKPRAHPTPLTPRPHPR